MRIGVLGDIHQHDERLALALEAFQAMNLDMILFVGDVVDGMGSLNRSIELLKKYGVRAIKGNHDTFLPDKVILKRLVPCSWDNSTLIVEAYGEEIVTDDTKTYINNLPDTLEIQTPDGLLLLCHGMGQDAIEFVIEECFDRPELIRAGSELERVITDKKYAFVVSGHSHKAYARRHEGVAFFNAGSLTGGFYAGYCVLDTKVCEMEYYRFSWKDARRHKGPVRVKV